MSNTRKSLPCTTTRRADGIAVITIDNPPVNAFSSAVSQALEQQLETAIADSSVKAIVLIGTGRTFIAGVDIRELAEISEGKQPPLDLYPLLLAIENSPKPIVAAIHGTALGGGLELAMAAHYRVASAGAQFGQPEVKLGLIPGMAGTQRLPRLVGLEDAARMCCWGEPVKSGEALRMGLIDTVVEGDLLEGAIGFVSQKTIRKTRDLTLGVQDLGSSRKKLYDFRKFGGAPIAAFEAVEAAILPFDEGCRREKELFQERLRSLESKALIYAFFGERTVSKVEGSPARVDRVAVVGGGTMGRGIAMAFANAGIPVVLKETDSEALSWALGSIRKNYERSLARGKLSATEMESRIELIQGQTDYDGFESQNLVIEAVFEKLATKQKIFTELEAIVSPACLLATNTSSLDVDAIAEGTSRPERVLGLHFFSPANVMRLVEVIRGKHTSEEAAITGQALVRRLGKVGVLARNAPGFIGNRIFAPYLQEARLLVEEGAPVEQVNKALTDWGMAMGPLAVDDLTGLDISLDIEEEFAHRLVGFEPKSGLLRQLVESGRLGQKNGRGWSRYDKNRQPHPDEEVTRLVTAHRIFTDQEIVDRCMSALIAEGRRVLEEGVASREVDIDMVFLHGFGFPAWRGGPMFFAKHARGDLPSPVPRQ